MTIPIGNTVMLAGDPGTGKTTILLDFFRYARFSEFQQGVTLCVDTSESEASGSEEVFNTINKIVIPHNKNDGQEKSGEQCKEKDIFTPVLRIFISLESSFERIASNQKHLMTPPAPAKDSGAEGEEKNKDINVFIDATAMLSGRLEDSLRYPKLAKRRNNEGSYNGWSEEFQFNLGGYETPRSADSKWYWQPGKSELKDQVGIDDLPAEGYDRGPFGKKANSFRRFVLMCPPIDDPMIRLQLVKDLLAQTISELGDGRQVVLTVDSLSALLARFTDAVAESKETYGRRVYIVNLVRWLEENGVTSIMAVEANRDGGQTLRKQQLFLGAQERYIASGVIQLDYHQYQSGDLVRNLRVLKMRGAAHDMRPYAYELDERGLSWIEPLYADTGS